jgi:hypothetical protein
MKIPKKAQSSENAGHQNKSCESLKLTKSTWLLPEGVAKGDIVEW